MTNKLEAALKYAEKGWRVHPCEPHGKRPLLTDWPNRATADPEKVRAMWTAHKNANIGIATGAETGLVVVDIDNKGVNGYASLAKYEAQYGELKRGCIVGTPTGGLHIYYAHPGSEIRNSANVLPGVDIRGDGGYVVAAASEIEGVGEYVLQRQVEELPVFKPFVVEKRAPVSQVTNGSTLDPKAYGAKALSEELGRVVGAPEGERNDQLNRASFSLGQLVAGGELGEEATRQALLRAASGCGLLEDGEASVLRTINSGLRSGAQHPRSAPELRITGATSSPGDAPAPAGGAENKLEGVDFSDVPRVGFWKFADSPPHPTRWIIHQLIPESSCIIIGAEMKTGKSMLMVEMALAVAMQGAVLGEFWAKERGDVIIVSPEGSRYSMGNRLYGFCWSKGVDPMTVNDNILQWPGRFSLDNKMHMLQLQKEIYERKPKLVFVDPLVSATDGIDENDAGAMMVKLNAIRELLPLNPGMSIIITHHVNKAAEGASAFHGLRGSSALPAWADGLIKITRKDKGFGNERILTAGHRDADSVASRAFRIVASDVPECAVPALALERVEEEKDDGPWWEKER